MRAGHNALRFGRIALGLCLMAAGAAHLAVASSDEPAVPEGRDPGGVAVALIDTGVNYTLPEIAGRLARAPDGTILGYDFEDDDRRPWDLAPGDDAARARRHGTSVASILLHETPEARLVPMRYRAHDPAVFGDIVRAIASGPARIVAMPLGGYREPDWRAFRDAADAHGDILFVLSAGNDGRNLDEKPVYPAAFGLGNAIVVTSTDDFGRLPPESNWGPATVDISTPGERLWALDHRGARLRVSGSSFAVPRIAALAARLKAANPDWDARHLKAAILALADVSPGDRVRRTRHGWIANPARAAP